jgi:SAM-dependent methyltransferase
MSAGDPRDEVAAYWSANMAGTDAFSPQMYWLAVPRVQSRFQRLACGGAPYASWVDYVVKEFMVPRGLCKGRVLSLGCGSGALERDLARLDAFAECDAFDIAADAIEVARREAEAFAIPPIRYAVRDVQQGSLPEGAYAAAFFNGSLHHIEALEKVIVDVRRSLVPGGLLIFNEYVGARHFNFPLAQRNAITTAFSMLPSRYRRSFAAGMQGTELTNAPLPDWREVRRTDPSEAVRANEILPIVRSAFDIVTLNACGGSILQFLLSGIAGHFREEDPVAMAYLESVMRFEDALMLGGDVPSDFVVCVATPKSGSAAARLAVEA